MNIKKVPMQEVLFFQEGPGVRNFQYKDTGVKLLNVANLVNGKLDISTSERYISEEEAYGRYKHFLVDEGDFIIASSGIKVEYFDKKMGFVEKEHLPLCMNTSTVRFKVFDAKELDIKYFMYYLKSDSFKRQLGKLITGSAQLNFGPAHIRQMSIPLRSIYEQSIIVKKMELIVRILDLRRQQLVLLDVLIKSRFVEMFGELNKNPQNWEEKKVKDVFKVRSSKRVYQTEQTLSGVPFLRVSDLVNRIVGEDENFELHISKEMYGEFRKKGLVPKTGDILVTARGTLGLCYIVEEKDEFYFQDGMISWLDKQNEEVNSVYFAHLFKTDNIKKQLESVSSGTAVKYLSIESLGNFKVLLPPLSLQNQFSDFAQQIDKSKVAIQRSLDKAQELFDCLMQQYFG